MKHRRRELPRLREAVEVRPAPGAADRAEIASGGAPVSLRARYD
jgi:hypothetical protein